MNFTINSFMQFILLSANLFSKKIFFGKEKRELVTIHNGDLLGQVHDNYIAFKSIPYAEPPINENRFESPKPYLKEWSDLRDSRKYTHKMCPQIYREEVIGDEDCLYLNVFKPIYKSDISYPVMVFIHGGSFNYGSGNDFSEKNIMNTGKFIYVTINYRLGAFGFLSTQDNEISGNMGLKDQRLALIWIKKNIKYFNGDPEKILLCGWSAGGASVHYHLLSKETEYYVKAAVSYSGTALNSWAFDNSPVEKLHKLAKSLNCPIKNTKSIKNCLKKIPAKNITLNSLEFLILPFDFPPKGFTPVIESPNVTDPFLRDSPEYILHHDNVANIPWLVSHTSEEAGNYVPILLNELSELNRNFNSDLPILLYFDDDKQYTKEDHIKIITDLKIKYNIPETITKGDYLNLQKMFSDEHIIRKVQRSVHLHQQSTSSPVYMYIFDCPPDGGDMKFGAAHGNDMELIYNNLNNRNYEDEHSKDILIKILNMLEQFIQTKIPIYDNKKLPKNSGVSGAIKYLNIGKYSFSEGFKNVDLI